MTLLWILLVWLSLGVIAEIIGLVYEGKWNGIWECVIVVALGLIALLAVIADIQDEEFENKHME
jgi:hypothetical protein